MSRYNAWYNGSTTITLTGNPNECPSETLGPISNALGIGGMNVPGNSSLDRSIYDKNPFYFTMPSVSGKNMSAKFQSSNDYYIDETQSWRLSSSKSGDGYDVTGYWIGTLPTENWYYQQGTKCWDGGDQYPTTGSKSNGENWHWNVTARLTPESATWTFDQTWFDKDDVEWHTLIKFDGQAYTDGPRLVTTGDAPTTEGCLGCKEVSSGSSSTGSGSSSATRTGSSSSTSSTSGSSSGSGSSTNGAVTILTNFGTLSVLGTFAIVAALCL